MPFKSQAQRAWMYANHPDMAKQWEKDTPRGALPKRVATRKGGGARRSTVAPRPRGPKGSPPQQ